MRRTAINKKASKKAKELFIEKGIEWCEKCGTNYMLTIAHRHKRIFYYDKPDDTLWAWKQIALLCQKCHDEIEYSREKTQNLFNELRGEE